MASSLQYAVLAAAAIVGVTSGCSIVRSTGPMGASPVSLVPEEWNGTWQAPGSSGFCVVQVTDPEAGKMDVALLGIEDEQIRMRTLHVQIRQSGDWTFFSVPVQEFAKQGDDVKDGYFWGRIKKEGDRVVFWLPHFKRIEAAVAEGRLPGRKKSDNDVEVGAMEASHYEWLTSEKAGVLVDWENPAVLIRMPP